MGVALTAVARRSGWRLAGIAWLALAGCGGGPARALADAPRLDDARPSCQPAADPLRPLLVEWPATQRSALEARLQAGPAPLVVRYGGCELQVLRRCRAPGRYRWLATQPKREQLRLRNADEVHAKVPLGAARLVAAVERHGELRLDLTVVGEFASERAPGRDELIGECEGATHVVAAVAVGAFELASAAGAGVEAGAELPAVGVGGRSEHDRGYLARDGEAQACRGTRAAGPPQGCGAPLELELVELPGGAAAAGAGGEKGGEEGGELGGACPSGMAEVPGGTLETAAGTVGVATFCLDREEVSAAAYQRCVELGECTQIAAPTQTRAQTAEPGRCNLPGASRRRHPVNCLDWAQARAYCRAQGRRLPRAAELEWAARGGEQRRRYPWGDEAPSSRHLNACGRECDRRGAMVDARDGHVGTAPVASFPAGRGRWGLDDLAGNVAEWSETAVAGERLVVGGSARSRRPEQVRAGAREAVSPELRRADVGVRCAAQVE